MAHRRAPLAAGVILTLGAACLLVSHWSPVISGPNGDVYPNITPFDVYFSTWTMDYIPQGPGVLQVYPEGVYRYFNNTVMETSPSLRSQPGLDALHAYPRLFSTNNSGPASWPNGSGPNYMYQNEVYSFSLDSESVSVFEPWAKCRAKIYTLDALTLYEDGFLFSVSGFQYVRQFGVPSLWLNPANVYACDPSTGDITLFLDLWSYGISNVDALHYYENEEGGLIFSVSPTQFIVNPYGGVQQLWDSSAYGAHLNNNFTKRIVRFGGIPPYFPEVVDGAEFGISTMDALAFDSAPPECDVIGTEFLVEK